MCPQKPAHAWCRNKFVAALDAGVPLVVVDNTNTQAWEYTFYVNAAMACGYRVAIAQIHCPDADTARRLGERNAHGVPVAHVRRMWKRMKTDTRAMLVAPGFGSLGGDGAATAAAPTPAPVAAPTSAPVVYPPGYSAKPQVDCCAPRCALRARHLVSRSTQRRRPLCQPMLAAVFVERASRLELLAAFPPVHSAVKGGAPPLGLIHPPIAPCDAHHTLSATTTQTT